MQNKNDAITLSRAQQLLDEFFRPQEAILRMNLLKDTLNKSKRKAEITLEAFYLSTRPRDRISYLFNFETDEEAKKAIKDFEKNLLAEKKKKDEAKKLK